MWKFNIEISEISKLKKLKLYRVTQSEFFTRENTILKYICKIVRHSGDFPDSSCQSSGMFQDASRRRQS